MSKALAFRPIDDIKDFVYSYVLDEKEVNIDVLRENVRSYQDLHRTLENVKIRIGRLEKISGFHDQAVEGDRKDKMYAYFLERVDADLIDENIKLLMETVASDENSLEEKKRQIHANKKEQDEKQQIRDDLRTELASDKDFIARDEQKKKLHELQIKKEALQDERQILLSSVGEARKQTKLLLKMTDVAECVKAYDEDLAELDRKTDMVSIRDHLSRVITYKNDMRDKILKKKAEVSVQISHTTDEKQEIDKKIENLMKKKLSYPEDVERVMSAIREEFIKIGRKPAQLALCRDIEETAGDVHELWIREYEKQISDKSLNQFKENYTRRRKANQTTIDKNIDAMKVCMTEYKTTHDFGAAATMEGYADFELEFIKLKNSELLKYEEKVESARMSAEEEFREQFLSKLQENMKTAQGEFKELNKALNDIVFSFEEYKKSDHN